MKKNTTSKPLTLFERERIGVYKGQGKSGRQIAKLLKRSHTTINRELKRNNNPHAMMKGYIGYLAHQQAGERKKQAGRRLRLKSAFIRSFCQEKIIIGWSPEQIAHRIRIEHKGTQISHEAIYQYIYFNWKDGIQFLARRHPKRYPKNRIRKRHKPPILNRVDISLRPAIINKRKQAGHWESDTVESNQSLVCLNVLYERVSRLIRLSQLPDRKAQNTRKAIISKLKPLPEKARKSITYDNGPENYDHQTTNQQLGTKSYFCQPYHSWEKGGVENTNSLLRRFMPKKTNFAMITQEDLDNIQELLNNRPRKCLGFKTPNEVFYKLYGAGPY